MLPGPPPPSFQGENVPPVDRQPATEAVAIIGEAYITDSTGRPRRYLDHFSLLSTPGLQLCFSLTARTDEALEEWYQRRTRHALGRMLIKHGLPLWTMTRHLRTLRRARAIFCHGPHFFWLLLILNRLGIFPVPAGRTVRSVFFHSRGFTRKLGLFRRAPAGFEAAFATRTQVEELIRLGASSTRVLEVPWRIDTTWFRPADPDDAWEFEGLTPRAYILCAGTVHRDETLVRALVGQVGLPIVRAGRREGLRAIYADVLTRPDAASIFQLRVNLNHRDYRRLVQHAALVLLPIEPCDEPAGLTAALETLACQTPVVANESLGVGPLLREAGLANRALLPDLRPETWRTAILARRDETRMAPELWQQARRWVQAQHSIRPDGVDTRWVFAAPQPATL